MEIVTSWMEEGIRQGELKVIKRQIRRSIGKITPELEAQLENLFISQLDDLFEVLLDFTAEADLVKWLQQQQQKSE
ncbi:MAG TPA: DUF4351 domain-containing protein [Nostocaceae cyanobacterium]|nr:DUF4351 domain-containing protein [Nostocaceae cyanobacterium]